MEYLRIQRRARREAIARAMLAAVCYPGYSGEGDHSEEQQNAMKRVKKCAAAIIAPIGTGK